MDALWTPFIIGLIFLLIVIRYGLSRSINKNPKLFKQNIIKIQKEGELLYEKNCGGRIGSVNLTIGFLRVKIYDSGIIFSSCFFPSFCLLKNEISNLKDGKLIFTAGTEIIHTSQFINKYVFIYYSVPYFIKDKLLK